MNRCNSAQQAFVRTYFLNCVSAPQDYRLMRMGAKAAAADWAESAAVKTELVHTLDDVTWDVHTRFPQPDVPKHGSAVLGLPDAAQFLKTRDEEISRYWLKLVNASVGAPAWTLVAYAAWMTAAEIGVLRWMDAIGWFDHDVRDSIEACGPRLVAARRALKLQGQPQLSVDDVLVLRKMANISDRNKEEADWDAERHRRTVDTAIHWYPNPDGTVSRDKWNAEAVAFLKSFTLRVARKMSSNLRLVDIDEWWASRYGWASSGSSSQTSAARSVLEAGDMVPDKQSRPNKKAVAVTLPEGYIWLQMMRKPIKKPRKSTKNEPGRKNRALYAQDDDSFFVSAFASVAMERSINEDGIYARQAPQDVVNWMYTHKQLSARKMFFLSLDYSDYNTEHEPTMLAALDAAWAVAWSRVAQGRKQYVQKAWAAQWSAEAHLNSWVDFGYGQERVVNGLFSGDRNTSRDNCIKHAMYSHLIQKATREHIPWFSIAGLCMTGDDEDAAFGSSVQAACYMSNHARAGFVLKVEKQLAGTCEMPTHEYLQRALTSDGRPSRPLAAALAQTMSGNWYKTQFTWFDSVITSTCDNAWELHTRGLPLDVARFVAGKVLSRTLTVPDGTGRRDLEWWNYRSSGSYSPLWGTVTDAPPKLTDPLSAVKADPIQHGIVQYSGLMRRRFGERYPEQKARRYELSCAKQALSSIFVKDRFQVLAAAASEVWPTRTNRRVDVLKMTVKSTARLSEKRLTALVTQLGTSDMPESRREVLSRFGVDEELVETLGGIREFIRSLRPHEMQYWSETVEPAVLPNWAMHEDPAVRSQLAACLGTNCRQYARYDTDNTNSEYAVVMAGNAAGKTTALTSNRAGSVVDMDQVFRKAGVATKLRWLVPGERKRLPLDIALPTARQLCQTPGRILLTQHPLEWIEQILKLCGATMGKIVIVETNADTVWNRSAAERAWNYAKALRRTIRFTKNATQAATRHDTTRAASVSAAVASCILN